MNFLNRSELNNYKVFPLKVTNLKTAVTIIDPLI